MLVKVNKEVENKIISFTKYAQFISEKFGVTVEFDGVKAHTDGTTITLPNLLGMTQKEIDFLYCVLLHEVGHIKYSTFTKEAFAKIKTDAHFSLSNAIEDARIENLLMNEYDGAQEVFHSLYNDFAQDKAFIKKVFGFNMHEVDDFKGLTTYLHYKIIDLNKKISLEEILGKKLGQKVAKFVLDNKIDQLVDKNPLKDWDDVITLSNKIYDLYFKTKKDTSGRNEIPELEIIIDTCTNDTLAKMQKEQSQKQGQMDKLSQQIKELKEQIGSMKSQNKGDLETLEKELEKLEALADKMDSYQDAKKELKSLQDKTSKNQGKQQSKEQKLKELDEKLKELEAKAQELKAKSEKETSDEKKQKLEERMKSLQEKINKNKERTQKELDYKGNYSQKLQEQTKEIEELNKEIAKHPEMHSLSDEEIAKQLKAMQERITELNKEIYNKKTTVSEKQSDLKSLQEQLRTLKGDMAKRLAKELKQVQEQLDKAGVKVSLMPAFENTPGWGEADEAQKEFDEQASQSTGDVVTNGAGFGAGSRDVMAMIEKAKEDLGGIDLAKIFKEKHSVSKLDELNDFSQINNTLDNEKDEVALTSSRRHLPLTTRYDKVTNKTISKGDEIEKMKKSNAFTLKKLKEIFKLKMKSHKKDRFKGNQEEGSIDARNLWKLATKTDSNYFEVSQPRHINNVAASVAIDISGSMDKDYTEHGKKLKEVSMMLSEALKECYVKHEVCGFHAPVSHELRNLQKSPSYNRTSNVLETVVYRQFNDKHSNGIENLEIQCADNSDGESVKFIATRLLRERAKRRVLFVISDGKPFLTDSDVSVLDQDLKNTLQWCRANKVEVYGIGFNPQGKAFYGDNYCHITKYEDLLDFCNKKLACS